MFAFDAYFFDFDGTIGDTAPDIRGSWLNAIKKLGLPENDFEKLFRIGPSIQDTAKILYPDNPEVWEELQNAYKYFYDINNDFSHTTPYPGIIEKITGLHNAGKKVYIVTNKRMLPLRKLISIFKLKDLCSGFFVPDIFDPRNHFNKKELALLALNISGVLPDRALMVGDTELDIAAGKYAAIKTCAVTWGYGESSAIHRESPDFTINNIADLP